MVFKFNNLAYKTEYQRFKPYFNIIEVERESQFYITDEHRRLFVFIY